MDVVGDRMDMSVLERQRARMQWQQGGELHQEDSYFNRNEFALYSAPAHAPQFQSLVDGDLGLNQLVTPTVKVDLGLESGWPEYKCVGDVLGFGSCGFGNGNGSAIEVNYGVPVAANCPPAAAVTKSELEVPVPMADTRGRESVLQEKLSSAAGRESFKKRKAGHTQNPKMLAENDTKEKKIKRCAEEGESKITEQSSNTNRETSADTSKENSKVSEVQKPDYIHVRARRGQATDSHSLAERVRREKISERMKYLQDLVPGCNKITGKAGMLDEIINYVQSLQRQVEYLSMKLAAMNPSLDFNLDNFFAKEVFPACGSNISTIGGVSSEMPNPAYHQFNPLQQLVSCCGLEMGTNAPDMTLRRTISAPVSIPETFLDSSCFNQIQNSTWDTDLQNLYDVEFHQGRSTPFPSQQFIGSLEASNLTMEM